MSHEYYMQIALQEAEKSLAEKILPVGAVLVVDGEIVAQTHKGEMNSYHLDHAEILLVREYFKDKHLARGDHDIVLYTTLEPCMMCLGTIFHLPIRAVVYAAQDPYGGGCSIVSAVELPFRHKKNMLEVIPGICEFESKKIFKEFLKTTDIPFYQDTTNPLVKYLNT